MAGPRVRIAGFFALGSLVAGTLTGCVVINTAGGNNSRSTSSNSFCPPDLASAFESAIQAYDPDVEVIEADGTSFQPSVIVPALYGSCLLESGATTVSPAAYLAFIPNTIPGDALTESLTNAGFRSDDGLAWTSPKSEWLLTVTALEPDTYSGFDPAHFPQYVALLVSTKP